MKVIQSEDNLIVFDNGLQIIGEWDQDCCEYNYLDFEQLPVDTELPDMDIEQFSSQMNIKEDGFSIKDIEGTPKWVQARSNQNGYYFSMVEVILQMGDTQKRLNYLEGIIY